MQKCWKQSVAGIVSLLEQSRRGWDELRMGIDEEQRVLCSLQQVWETWGVKYPACPSIRKANKGQQSTDRECPAGGRIYLRSPWGSQEPTEKTWLICQKANGSHLGVGLGVRDCSWVFLGWWKAGVQRTEFSGICRHRPRENVPWVRVSGHFPSSYPSSWPGTCWSQLLYYQW